MHPDGRCMVSPLERGSVRQATVRQVSALRSAAVRGQWIGKDTLLQFVRHLDQTSGKTDDDHSLYRSGYWLVLRQQVISFGSGKVRAVL